MSQNKNINLDSNTSYSQYGEDMVLKSFYESEPYNYRGFYIDIGAHHPHRFSNTQYFYDRNWTGINIDATPGSMLPFRDIRANDLNLEIGISQEESTITFYCFDEPALNTFSKEVSDNLVKTTRFNLIKEVSVNTYPLKEILGKYLRKKQKIDFLSIDVEGLDYQVLQSNNWDDFIPMYILVEDVHINLARLTDSDTYNFLVNKNYELVAKTLRTCIFQHKVLGNDYKKSYLDKLLQEGIKYFEEKEYYLAEENLIEYCDYNNHDSKAFYYLGLSNFEQNKFEESLKYFSICLEMGMYTYEIFNSSAKALEFLGDENTAKVYYQKALQLKSQP